MGQRGQEVVVVAIDETMRGPVFVVIVKARRARKSRGTAGLGGIQGESAGARALSVSQRACGASNRIRVAIMLVC
jgi:hypothetical protein